MFNLENNNNLISFYKQLIDQNVPNKEYEKKIMTYLENKARIQAVPFYGHFELTPMCNLDCKMCYVHLNKHQFHQEQLLSVETWKELISQAQAAGMLRCSLTGGECLTYPGFDEVYLYLYNSGIIPNVLTNGVLLDDERIKFFKKYPPKLIQVSLYGSSNDAYEKVTGKRVFDSVYQNLLRARKEELPITISITPNAFMKEDVRSLLEIVDSIGGQYHINASLFVPRENTGRNKEDLTDEEYVDFYKICREIMHSPAEPLDDVELPDENHTSEKRYGIRCGAGRSSFAIMYDGSMCPCFSLGNIKVNALETGFQDAWKYINEAAKCYPIPAECVDCVYRDVCVICPGMHVNAPVFGHCDPRICERTKKMIKAGVFSMPNYKKI